jgi:hypothetical protein
MRLGCVGCGLLVVVVFAVGVAVAGALFLSVNLFLAPDVQPVAFTRGDGHAAQNKLFEVVMRQTGRSSRTDPVVLTDREANAFLSRHLEEAAGLRLSPIVVRFARNQVTVQGQTVLKNLLQGPPFAQVVPYIPDSRLDQPVWVTARGHLTLEPDPGAGGRRHGRFVIDEFALGKQPVSGYLVYVMMGSAGAQLLRWPVPGVVQAIDVEDGRVLIRTR